MDTKPKIIVISGITGSGKTALSVELAKKFNGEIVSCDSRQVYKYCDIATAKVTNDEMQGVPHHMLDVADPTTNTRYSVAEFVRDADRCISDIILRRKLPILVGGTGLYTRALIDGYNFDDAKPPRGDVNIRHKEDTTSISTKSKNSPKYNVLQICLVPPREIIADKIMKRIESRLDDGMIEETEKLIEMGVTKDFLLALGLEFYWNVKYIDGEITMPEYKTQLFNKSMQFIKRQRTWYRKENKEITHYISDPKDYMSYSMKLINLFLT